MDNRKSNYLLGYFNNIYHGIQTISKFLDSCGYLVKLYWLLSTISLYYVHFHIGLLLQLVWLVAIDLTTIHNNVVGLCLFIYEDNCGGGDDDWRRTSGGPNKRRAQRETKVEAGSSMLSDEWQPFLSISLSLWDNLCPWTCVRIFDWGL